MFHNKYLYCFFTLFRMKNEFDISLEIGLKVGNHEIKSLSSSVGKNELRAMLSRIELKRYRR